MSVMAEGKSDQGAKDEIKKGMSEAGKDAALKTRKEGGKGTSGSDQITKGMSEVGSSSATVTSGGDLSGRPDRPRAERAIDEAVDDSFPASDPPAWTSETGAGAPKGGQAAKKG
jgi:hypothetical protein